MYAIVTSAARLTDPAELATFLAAIPNGENLAAVLAADKPTSTRAYEDDTQTARFVESDGTRVMCFAVAEVTIDQAEMIENVWERVCALNEDDFRRICAEVLRT
jgi:hypothetical protein